MTRIALFALCGGACIASACQDAEYRGAAFQNEQAAFFSLPDPNGDGTCDDDDGDGYTTCDGDCDDTNGAISPDAIDDNCDGVDDDCSGIADDADTADCDEDDGGCVDYDLGTSAGYNVFVFGDYTGGMDVRGKIAAGGAVEMQYFSVAGANPGGDAIVADSVTLNGGTVYGNIAYTTSASVTSSVTLASGGAIVQDSPIDFADEQDALEDLSASLCGEAATGSTTVYSWGGIWMSGSASDVNVFSLDIADLESTVYLSLSATSGTPTVINVSGDSTDTIGSFGFSLSGVGADDVLWNFCDATTLSLSSIGYKGTILAPLADVTFNNGNFDGNIIAASLTGTAEGHHYPFDHDFEICEE